MGVTPIKYTNVQDALDDCNKPVDGKPWKSSTYHHPSRYKPFDKATKDIGPGMLTVEGPEVTDDMLRELSKLVGDSARKGIPFIVGKSEGVDISYTPFTAARTVQEAMDELDASYPPQPRNRLTTINVPPPQRQPEHKDSTTNGWFATLGTITAILTAAAALASHMGWL